MLVPIHHVTLVVYVEVHHKDGVDNWQEMYEFIRAKLLNEDEMEVLCKACHKGEHGNDPKEKKAR